jgi:uncharacterized protein
MKIPALILALACSTNLAFADAAAKSAHAETPKEKDIRHLLQLTGAAALGGQVMAQMLETFKSTMPNVPAKFWSELAKELDPNELVEMVIPIYDKQLSGPEIKDLIKFYETPTGKKLIKVMPAITQESMTVGKEWGRAIGDKVITKLKQEGLDKK